MNARFARFLLLFAALCLPVQAMAGLSMSLCRHAQEQATQPEAMPCHEAMAQDQQAPNHDAGCDNCEMCHIAGAGFMPSAAMTAGLLPAGSPLRDAAGRRTAEPHRRTAAAPSQSDRLILRQAGGRGPSSCPPWFVAIREIPHEIPCSLACRPGNAVPPRLFRPGP
jgi:hypothetical protein